MDISSQISRFIGKYTPEIAAAVISCRRRMHALVPRGYELVYDNYNALVFGYAPSEKISQAVLSLAAYPRWVTLFFLHGVQLDDPGGLLEGAGSQVRSIRLASAGDLDRPDIRKLVAQALSPCAEAFATAPPLMAVIKSISAKQRPRRPAGKPSSRPK